MKGNVLALRFGGQTVHLGDEKALTQAVVSENGMGFHYNCPNHPVVRRAVALVQETGAKDILDLGSGRGITASTICREVPESTVMATDINEIGLRQIQKEADKNGFSLKTMRFNAAANELPKSWVGRYDLVIAKDLYPFLTPQQVTKMLRNAANALKSGGLLLLTAPSPSAWTYREAPKNGGNPFYRILSKAGQSYAATCRKYFSYANIRYLSRKLEKVGLDLVSAQPFGREKGWLMVVAQRSSK